MKNLLIITQKVDENDDHRGFFIDWLKEFAKKFEKVSVITIAKGSYTLPENIKIYSLGKEHGAFKIIQAMRFYWHLARLIPGSDGIFAHASAIFVIASWPFAFIYRKKIILWYLHRSVTLRLKLAEKFCYKIVTSTRESLNFKSGKIVESGHGVDIEKFKFDRKFNDFGSGPIEILSVGRISKIKNYETLIKAAQNLKDRGLMFKINIIGRPVMSYDFEYFEHLKKMVSDSGLKDFIEFTGFVPYSNIASYYKRADIFINLTPRGGIDKAVIEGMASGCITFVSNDVFEKYFGNFSSFLIFKHGDASNLVDKILNVLKLPDEKVKEISSFFQESILTNHNLPDTISRISSLFNL
ncbi:MAG: hypothetical protein A2913_01235 [Parcubacteria group bacterium RIFCSPLOWO2_01_FULL_40_65]|nr:MAG: hypothetical protein A2734_00880 [Parcubacteria group bacterium RIFCSPHIGHO2_01_FULL_40_30]OHB19509.1 MAG: hypothetical protein A3D40_02605 [Parcubacteria group bacterium RIFCSPHIGHO2_02_FULL_40_12]OHB22111.1 MAG: hypothetical protein A2913_01235 [Parcubacteria group bacterium RIFCSPLOWO2_01_FULL_40_65]OHB24403.1 MAG: hypothetical protein A3F96_00825 [Parcubacteria group bacterium RIFCSPLOWO2_12_FULL_40_10]